MINSSFNKTKNYIVIDKGATEGIQPEMAVCSSEGVVGIIEKVSNRYARVLPLSLIHILHMQIICFSVAWMKSPGYIM